MHSEGISWWRRERRVTFVCSRLILRPVCGPSAPLRLSVFVPSPPPGSPPLVRDAHDAAESDTHESSARAYTRRGAHLSRPPVTPSSILVAPPPCDPVSSSQASAWPRSVYPRSTPPTQAAAGHVAFRGEPPLRYRLYRALRARPCVSPAVLLLFLNPAPPGPAYPVAFAYSPSRSLYYPPSLLFPFIQLYLSSLSLLLLPSPPLSQPPPRPSRVYPLCAGGCCFFRLFVLASSRAGNRRRRRRWRR